MKNNSNTPENSNKLDTLIKFIINVIIGTILFVIVACVLISFTLRKSNKDIDLSNPDSNGIVVEKIRGRKYNIIANEYNKDFKYININISENPRYLNEGAILSYEEYIKYYEEFKVKELLMFYDLSEEEIAERINEIDSERLYTDTQSNYIVFSYGSPNRNVRASMANVDINHKNREINIYLAESIDGWMGDGTAYMMVIPTDCEPDYTINFVECITASQANAIKHNIERIQLDKPVIYLYPEEETQLEITLNFDGSLGTTYPKYDNGWSITAKPDGTLVDASGRQYNYLFWEGTGNLDIELNEGFCIKGEDIEEFLEEKLTELGLTDKEQCDFITYWLPQMENNKYNIIKFLEEEYTDKAKLSYTVEPDSEIRVYMYCVPSEEYVELKEQKLETPERKGFTVVEWGGTVVN